MNIQKKTKKTPNLLISPPETSRVNTLVRNLPEFWLYILCYMNSFRITVSIMCPFFSWFCVIHRLHHFNPLEQQYIDACIYM